MEIKRLGDLSTETLKNPNYIKEIFYLSPHETHKKYDLFVHSRNAAKYGNNSLRVLEPHIWNSLPE